MVKQFIKSVVFLYVLALVGCESELKFSIRERSLDLTLTNFSDEQIISYPVGVFNLDDELIGLANNDHEYVTIWNGDAVNLEYGLLEETGNNFKFKVKFNANQVVEERPIHGMRFFKFEITANRIDSFSFPEGSLVDFGDGIFQKFDQTTPWHSSITSYKTFIGQVDHYLGNGALTQAGYGLYLNNYSYSIVKTYPDSSQKTVTVYHNDNDYFLYTDNVSNPSPSPQLENLRGHFPLHTKGLMYTCTTKASFNTLNSLNYLEFSKHLEFMSFRDGDGINFFNNFNFHTGPQGNPLFSLDQIEAFDFGSVASVVDGFTIMDRLENNDILEVFPKIHSLALRRGQYSTTLNFRIPNFKIIVITIDGTTGMSSTDFDRILIELDSVKNDTGGVIAIRNMTRTAASNAAYNSLVSKGVSIRVNNWLN